MNQGGPFDECYLNGAWSAEQQALHGGPIPCRGGAPLSRGVPEIWPYARSEIASSQSMWANSWTTQPRQQTDWTNMDCNEFPKTEKARCAASSVPAVTPTDAYGGYLVGTLPKELKRRQRDEEWFRQAGSLRHNPDGSKRKGGRKLNKQRTRGGCKRKQVKPGKPERNKEQLRMFFGNSTYASEKTKAYLVERNDDVILIAESHLKEKATLDIIKFFGS